MTPEDVPDSLLDAAHAAWRRSDEQDTASVLADVLAAVLPRLESLVRAHIAANLKYPVTPANVPAALVDVVVEVFEDQAHENCTPDEPCPGNTRPYHESLTREGLAEALPVHEQMVREQVAKEIEDHFRDKINDVAVSEEADRALTRIAKTMYLAARIARGEQS